MGRPRSAAGKLLEDNLENIVTAYVTNRRTLKSIADDYPGATKPMVRRTLLNAGVLLRPGGPGNRNVDRELADAHRTLTTTGAVVDLAGKGALVGLRDVRRFAGLTQGQLASAMRVDRSRVSLVERDRIQRTTVDTVSRYVDSCGARLQILVTFDGHPPETVVVFDTHADVL